MFPSLLSITFNSPFVWFLAKLLKCVKRKWIQVCILCWAVVREGESGGWVCMRICASIFRVRRHDVWTEQMTFAYSCREMEVFIFLSSKIVNCKLSYARGSGGLNQGTCWEKYVAAVVSWKETVCLGTECNCFSDFWWFCCPSWDDWWSFHRLLSSASRSWCWPALTLTPVFKVPAASVLVDELVASKASKDWADDVTFISTAPQFCAFLGSCCVWNDLHWQNLPVI